MNRQERGVGCTINYFNHRPTSGDIYSYTPIPNLEMYRKSQQLLELPIRLVDEKLDPQNVWLRVEKWLIYWESNFGKTSDALPITDKIQMTRLLSSGYSGRLLAITANKIFPKFVELRGKPYGRSQIEYFRNRVTQALYGVLTADEKEIIGLSSEKRNGYESRIDKIYEIYPQVLEIILKLSQEEKFKTIWERNPHFGDILTRLLNGKNLLDIASLVGFDKDKIKNTPVLTNSIYEADSSFKHMLLNGEHKGRSYMILRRLVFAKFFNFGIDWHGRDSGKKFYEAITRLLENPKGGMLERFIELIPALEYLGMLLNSSHTTQLSDLEKKFPDFVIKNGDVDTTTTSREKVLKYMERFSESQRVSPGIMCLAEHIMVGGYANQVAVSLEQMGFRNSQGEMEMIIGKGLFFIEQVLLSDKKDFKGIDDETLRSLFKERTERDIQFLMTRISQEIKQNIIDKSF